jgi:hypothetical protein
MLKFIPYIEELFYKKVFEEKNNKQKKKAELTLFLYNSFSAFGHSLSHQNHSEAGKTRSF